MRDPTPCRRAAYHLILEEPSVGGWAGSKEGRHVLAVYILFFFVGLLLGAGLFHFVNQRKQSAPQKPHGSPSEKERELLSSTATPQFPSSASLLSDGFRGSEKRNGTTSTTTTTTLLSNHGNGGHHGNCFSPTSNSNPSNGLYANRNTSSSELKLSSEKLAANRTGVGESGHGDEIDKGLRDGLGEVLDIHEIEYKDLLARSQAPLAKCEESSI